MRNGGLRNEPGARIRSWPELTPERARVRGKARPGAGLGSEAEQGIYGWGMDDVGEGIEADL